MNQPSSQAKATTFTLPLVTRFVPAPDSPADQATIAEVLAAYVRGHAPWPPQDEDGQPAEAEPWDRVAPLKQRAPDVQAALTVLGRMPRPRFVDDDRLDLTVTDLRCADLQRLHLERTLFLGAHLEGALLAHAHLENAVLDAADQTSAFMNGTHLEGASLLDARLEGALLDLDDLPDAAHLDGAILSRQAALGAPSKAATADRRTRAGLPASTGRQPAS